MWEDHLDGERLTVRGNTSRMGEPGWTGSPANKRGNPTEKYGAQRLF